MIPFFSIIIPVYNVAPHLRECLDSVLSQTFNNWEAICVDDGSTDNGGDILAEYADKDTRIKVVRQKNSGVVAARLAGFCDSCGHWVLFLDGDDQLRSDCLTVLSSIVSTCSAEMVQFGYERVEQNGARHLCLPVINGEQSFNSVLANCEKSPLEVLRMCLWDKCYRRDLVTKVFSDIGSVKIAHSEDGLFAFAAFLYVSKVMFVREAFYKYNIMQGSASHKINTSIVADKDQFLKKLTWLALKSSRMTEKQIDKMIKFHSYQACCYIFLMLVRNHASIKNVLGILQELKTAEYFRVENAEVNSFKRRLIYVLLRHPAIFLVMQRSGFLGKL